MWINILTYSIYIVVGYCVTKFIFDVILRGFSPFISSRPWIIKQILDELSKYPINNNPTFKAYSFNCGRSGFAHALHKKYPKAQFVGYEKRLYPYLVAKVQAILRRSKMKVKLSPHFHRAYVADADLIYSYISDTKTIREMGEKFKFECSPGTLILSNGFIMPSLEPFQTQDLLDISKGRSGFLSRDRRIPIFGRKKSKKENKVFYARV